jgi:hypothetical protein
MVAALRIMRDCVDSDFGKLNNWGAHLNDANEMVLDLVNLGSHILPDGVHLIDFAVNLPHRCKHSGASSLSMRTQWIELDEYEAKESRGEYPGETLRYVVQKNIRF